MCFKFLMFHLFNLFDCTFFLFFFGHADEPIPINLCFLWQLFITFCLFMFEFTFFFPLTSGLGHDYRNVFEYMVNYASRKIEEKSKKKKKEMIFN